MSHIKGLKILIVEDDEKAASALRRLLQLDGYHVQIALGYREANQLIAVSERLSDDPNAV